MKPWLFTEIKGQQIVLHTDPQHCDAEKSSASTPMVGRAAYSTRDQGATRTSFRGIVGIQKQTGVAHGGRRRTHQALAVHRDSGVKDDIPAWQTLRFSEAYDPKTLNPKP